MGADIYLTSIYEKNMAEHEPAFGDAVKRRSQANEAGDKAKADEIQKEVSNHYNGMYADDGYFQDSYNNTSLFRLLGLSWWNVVGDMLDDNGHLPIENAKKLRQMVVDAPITLEVIQAKGPDYFPKNTREELVEYFTNDRKKFVALLDKSIELNEPLRCSI